jgi:tetratricopeptide (TPR) repeat protein
MLDHTSKTRLIGCVLLLSLLVGNAAAQTGGSTESTTDACLEDPKCSQLCEQARVLSGAGQYEGALFAYQMAFGLYPQSWLLVNVGRMQQKSGRKEQATATFRKFLEDTSPREGAPPATQSVVELRIKVRQYLLEAESTPEELRSDVEPPPAAVAQPAQVESDKGKPVYRRWWFGAAVGGGVAVLGLITIIAVTASQGPKMPSTDGLTVLTATF